MKPSYRTLAGRIRHELPALARVAQRAQGSLEAARRADDDRYVDAAALNLHGQLDRYRGLRHVVRNAYTYNLDAGQIAVLVADVGGVVDETTTQRMAFAAWLDAAAG